MFSTLRVRSSLSLSLSVLLSLSLFLSGFFQAFTVVSFIVTFYYVCAIDKNIVRERDDERGKRRKREISVERKTPQSVLYTTG